MKNLLFTSLFALLLFSCKKDYTCTCTSNTTTTDYFGTYTSTSTYSYSLNDLSKKDAEKACEQYVSSAQSFGFSSNSSCTLD
jgi:hypothetical protein